MTMRSEADGRAAEEEVDFARWFALIIRHRWVILGICAGAVLSFTVAQLRQPPSFSSQTTVRIDVSLARQVVGGRGYGLVEKSRSLEDWQRLLRDRSWTMGMVRKRDAAPLVGQLRGRQRGDAVASAEETVDILRKALKVVPEGQDTLTLKLEGAVPAAIAGILEAYVSELRQAVEDDYAANRKRALAAFDSEKRYLIQQLGGAGDRSLKDKLAETIVAVQVDEAVLRAPGATGFLVVLPPAEPERRAAPLQWLRAAFVAGLAFLVSVFLLSAYERLSGARFP